MKKTVHSFPVDSLSGPLLDIAVAEALGYATAWNNGPRWQIAGDYFVPCERSNEWYFCQELAQNHQIEPIWDGWWHTDKVSGCQSRNIAICRHFLKVKAGESVEIRQNIVAKALQDREMEAA